MKKYLFLLFAFSATSLSAVPRQVILIRHAEKPESGPHLSLKGKERAAALAPFFLKTPELNHHGRPAAIFVQRSRNSHNSMRAQETMKPLADALHMRLNKKYARRDQAACAKEILTNHAYDGKMVIACFEHQTLALIASGLGVHPQHIWPNGAWDLVWIIDFDKNGKAKLRKLPQRLMYGDSRTVK